MDSNSGQCPDLPKELLSTIGKLLDTRTDVLRFRAVCSAWRSSLTPIPIHNLLSSIKLPFPIAPNPWINPQRHGYFSLIESTVYYLHPLLNNTSTSSSSSKGWLVNVMEEKEGKMSLLDPLSNALGDLPSNSLPKVVKLLNFRVFEVKKVYNLQFVDLSENPETNFNELMSLVLKKVVVSSPSSPAGTGAVDDCAIMTIHGEGKLGYFKFGDNKWITIDDDQENSLYVDVVYHKGKFYAVDVKGRVLVIDSSLKLREIAPPARRVGVEYGGGNKHLVESFGDLFLIDRFFNEELEFYYDEEDVDYVLEADKLDYPVRFKVYKLNDEEKLWVPVKSLGDRAFFLGDDCCFSVSARDFPGCKGNCIYFTEVFFNEEYDDHPGFDTGTIDLEDDTVGPLSSCLSYSQIFWPPPTWLGPKPSSSCCRVEDTSG